MLILVSLIISVMTVVGTILISNIFEYYKEEFVSQQDEVFTDSLKKELSALLGTKNFEEQMKNALWAHSARIGVDSYRNYYILDKDGNYLSGSTDEENRNITKTHNLLSAISGTSSHEQSAGNKIMDYAVLISSDDGENSVIVYVSDTCEEMRDFSRMVFTILIHSLLIGLLVALVLSFFLSRAITAPIRKITKKATHVSEGNFGEKLTVYSNDEIGTLTSTFNKMAENLENTMKDISGERQKLETIFYYLKDSVIAFDGDGNTMHINPEAKELFTDADNLTLSRLIEELNLDSLSEGLSVEENDALLLNNVVYRDKVFDISFGRFRFDLAEGSFGGYITVLHDITEHFELEKSRREFIANVSHELGTPLTSIKGAAETIAGNPEMPQEMQSRFLQMVIGESDRMSHIVKDLLVLSRLDNRRMMWKPSSFSLFGLLGQCTDVVKSEADKASHKLILKKSDKDMPNMEADREKVEQVILNIIQNAVKYTQNNGTIEIFCDYFEDCSPLSLGKNDWFTVRVTDNGIGIPAEDLPHIFERFYRVEKARNSDKGGTGLGLAIAKEITLEHGGTITIDSEIKKGTQITVYLPKKANYIN